MPTFLIIILTGLVGLAGVTLAAFIHRKKAAKEQLICPVGFDCQTVVHSKYSRFLGMPVEDIGLIYYTFIVLSYLIFLFFPDWHSDVFAFAVISLTTLAFLFSVYLTYIQLVWLKQWCSWCLLSAALCTVIFLAAWSTTELNLVVFLNAVAESWLGVIK